MRDIYKIVIASISQAIQENRNLMNCFIHATTLRNNFALIFFLIFLLFGKITNAYAIAPDNARIMITSDELIVSDKHHSAVFKGKVIAIWGETKISSDRMKIHYKKNKGMRIKDSKIESIDINGGVKLEAATVKASADNGKYNIKTNEMVLIGNVKLQGNEHEVNAEKLVYNIKSKEVKLDGNSNERPKIILQLKNGGKNEGEPTE